MEKKNQLLNGDSEIELKKFPDNYFDVVATDPPYGLEFLGLNWDKAVPSVSIWKEVLRTMKPGAFAFVLCAPRQDVLAQMIVRMSEAGFDTGFSSIYWAYASGLPKAMDISKIVDKKMGKERQIISGTPKPEEYSGKFDQRSSTERPKDNGAVSEEAKALEGSYAGFQPKPAIEIVIVAMKPLSEKTYFEQALSNKKGITWLQYGRIPSETAELGFKGRFPANILVEDDILNDGSISKSPSGYVNRQPRKGSVLTGENCGFNSEENHASGCGDFGSFSRYFSLDAWWNMHIEKLPDSVKEVFPFLIVPKPSNKEKNEGLDGIENTHATVKPLKLMSYVITIGSCPGDIVLDPFVGSGTTCKASEIEGRKWVGIELTESSFRISQVRMGINPLTNKTESDSIDDLF